MKNKSKYIIFNETKKFPIKNIEFIKGVKYVVHSETPTAYIVKGNIEIDKEGEDDLYIIEDIKRGEGVYYGI